MQIRYMGGITPAYTPFALQALLKEHPQAFVVVNNNCEAYKLEIQLQKLSPQGHIVTFPAWDCLPYDRVSPSVDIMAARMQALRLLSVEPRAPATVIVPVAALLQRVVNKAVFTQGAMTLKTGETWSYSALLTYLTENGFRRRECVYEVGDFAVRGSLMDVFPPGYASPLRIDFFGDVVESLREFDVQTQKTLAHQDSLTLQPFGEVTLTPGVIERFKQHYREAFGHQSAALHKDPLFEHIGAGQPYPGMEHWLPLFYEGVSTLLDYMPNASLFMACDESAVHTFLSEAHNYYTAREHPVMAQEVYRALPPEKLYLTVAQWEGCKQSHPVTYLGFFNRPDATHVQTQPALDFAAARMQGTQALGNALVKALADHKRLKPVFVASTPGGLERLNTFLMDVGIPLHEGASWPWDADPIATLVHFPLEHGFITPTQLAITDQDLFGEKQERAALARRRSDKFFQDLSALHTHDVVVHRHHGFGRYDGLETLTINNSPHDCLRLLYADNDKLFLPVENIDLITRYGGDHTLVQLDKLGSSAWNNRKAKVKKRIAVVADYLIRLAAERALHKADALPTPQSAYLAFCNDFPYTETDDQLKAIEETLADLASGKPMDRLVCGDVGFGKTEVALRAAFAAVYNGKQVAVITPTSLLCRQHYINFAKRFLPYGMRVGQLSRLVSAQEAKQTKGELKEGQLPIVVGTHALLDDSIAFKDLGLVIVDEEQHFGVKQKEKLKNLKANVHVLTLTATPIPRTLQLSLTGVRDLSLITTPPVDRLAVRTFVMPFDGVVVREAIMREHQRGGQIFYVTPRLEDMEALKERLEKLVPEVRIITAHGQMPARELEDAITAFYEQRYDVLLSTNIIESGIDIPSANTLIIHRCDLFGLAQLYQLRGRVGRAKAQGYAYFTYEAEKALTETAKQRLDVLQRLDALGAGFSLASYDMDIRGAGNIVGEEQSGHIREVGVELYQNLLQEAIIMARAQQANEADSVVDPEWAPQINVGTAVLIPETYIADLGLRLAFYRRIGNVPSADAAQDLQQEMVDRFGKLPREVLNLFDVISLKLLCRHAGIEKVDAGPKGLVIGFHNNAFTKPDKLITLLQSPAMQQGGLIKIRPDHKIAFVRERPSAEERLKQTKRIIAAIAAL